MTLGDYRRFAAFAYGESSAATKYLDRKIGESPMGEAEQVLAAEPQMLMLLHSLSGQKDTS